MKSMLFKAFIAVTIVLAVYLVGGWVEALVAAATIAVLSLSSLKERKKIRYITRIVA